MLNADYRDMLSALLTAQAEFLVVGAHALAAHGLPRATGDLDIWIRPTADNETKVRRALEDFGAPLAAIEDGDLTKPDVVFQIGVAPCRIDIVTSIEAVTFQDAWTHRITIDIGGLRVPVLGRAEFLTNKRAVARPQDLADAQRLEEMDTT